MSIESAIQEGFRVLFLINVPILIGAIVAGLIVSCVMAATNVQEKSVGFAARLLAIVIIAYIMLETIKELIIDLAVLCFT